MGLHPLFPLWYNKERKVIAGEINVNLLLGAKSNSNKERFKVRTTSFFFTHPKSFPPTFICFPDGLSKDLVTKL